MNFLDLLNTSIPTDQGALSFGQMFWGILGAFFGGILASLTPCVYPMIPITVSVVGGFQSSNPERRFSVVAKQCAIYVSGMALVYSLLGVFAGITGRIFGTLTNNSTWYLIVGVILTFSSLLMFEVFRFDPMAWIERWKRKKPGHPAHPKKQTWIGVFGLGATSGLVAAPCTTPILTAILAFIANSKSVFQGMMLMISFSLGLSVLLLAVGLFAGTLKLLPKSGSWLTTLKVASGLILLGFAQYLFYLAGAHGGAN